VDGAALIEEHGLLLQAAKGPIPNVPELVVGEPVPGSWWGHPRHDEIFAVLNQASDSPDVVRLRLVKGKVTLVHRRLWPALVRLSDELGPDRLAAIEEEHTQSGAHRSTTVPYPDWVPRDVAAIGNALSRSDALDLLPECARP
jgi:hypothetical protein